MIPFSFASTAAVHRPPTPTGSAGNGTVSVPTCHDICLTVPAQRRVETGRRLDVAADRLAPGCDGERAGGAVQLRHGLLRRCPGAVGRTAYAEVIQRVAVVDVPVRGAGAPEGAVTGAPAAPPPDPPPHAVSVASRTVTETVDTVHRARMAAQRRRSSGLAGAWGRLRP